MEPNLAFMPGKNPNQKKSEKILIPKSPQIRNHCKTAFLIRSDCNYGWYPQFDKKTAMKSDFIGSRDEA